MDEKTEGLPPSKYLRYFQENAGKLRTLAQLTGDLLIVERIQFPEKKTAGGIYVPVAQNQLSAITNNMPCFFRVLLVGQGYYDDETGEDVLLEVNQGDIIQLPGASANIFSSFPMLQNADNNTIGVARAADIQWRFHGEASFMEFITGLNAAVAS